MAGKEEAMYSQQTATRWSPWRELERLQAEMDRLTQPMGAASAGEIPPMDVWANEDGVLVRALVPGATREDLEVSVVSDTLTVRGKLPAQELEKGESWHRHERLGGAFARTLQLPFTVDADAVKATCKNGVLAVELPRSPTEKPRRITVKAG
jgi:HSP20 family protein